jgi:hypothetical protein
MQEHSRAGSSSKLQALLCHLVCCSTPHADHTAAGCGASALLPAGVRWVSG